MLIDAQPDLESVGDVSEFYDLLVLIKSIEPDLIVLDWDCFGHRFATFQELMKLFPKPPQVVALSVREDVRDAALALGVTGFAYKGDPPSRLLDVIRTALRATETEMSGNGTGGIT